MNHKKPPNYRRKKSDPPVTLVKTFVASKKMYDLGVDPIEMLVRVYQTAMEDYHKGRGITEKGDNGAAWLQTAGNAAAKLAGYVYPTLSAMAVKDLVENQAIKPQVASTSDVMKYIQADPFAKVMVAPIEPQKEEKEIVADLVEGKGNGPIRES